MSAEQSEQIIKNLISAHDKERALKNVLKEAHGCLRRAQDRAHRRECYKHKNHSFNCQEYEYTCEQIEKILPEVKNGPAI